MRLGQVEAVENHMPEVVIVDEIGTEAEALACRTIAGTQELTCPLKGFRPAEPTPRHMHPRGARRVHGVYVCTLHTLIEP